MLTREQIIKYHLGKKYEGVYGFEYEIFCLDINNARISYRDKSTRDIENFLKKEGFKNIRSKKTIIKIKKGAKISYEPGMQLEYSSAPNNSTYNLINEFFELVRIYQKMSKLLDIKLLDTALYPQSNYKKITFIPTERYKIMKKYFDRIGSRGKEMMKDTTSLQLTFDYSSLGDLEKKVNRLIILKPILLILSSNSRVFNGIDTGYHSYREKIWQSTDSTRCGYPGYKKDRWTIDSYIEKVLNSKTIYDVVNKKYSSVKPKKFRDFIKNSKLASYIFQNNTIFFDIRIKDYIEMRYMDNPGIQLVPGLILLVDKLLNDDGLWKKFFNQLPYSFRETEEILNKINTINFESIEYWKKIIAPILKTLFSDINKKIPTKYHQYIIYLKEKTNLISRTKTKKCFDATNFLQLAINNLNKNLSKLI